MTWGLVEPAGFGQFFLDGDFVGWDEALKDHFFNGLSDEEREKYKWQGRDDVFDLPHYISEVSQKFIVNLQLHRLDPPQSQECPDEFAVERTRVKSFGSLVKLTNRLLAVDASLMAIIEGLEPGVHQFWPIKITMPTGETYPKQYYVLRICRFLDSFVPQESDVQAYDESEWGDYRVSIPNKKNFTGLAMSEAAIGGSHLWRERLLLYPDVLFSDALHSEIKKAGLKMPKLHKLKDVS
jgi:hypothetical protein